MLCYNHIKSVVKRLNVNIRVKSSFLANDDRRPTHIMQCIILYRAMANKISSCKNIVNDIKEIGICIILTADFAL